MTKLTAATPVDVRVIERREDGRGGVVEIPIVPETPFLDFSKTAGGGERSGSITAADLEQMAANFAASPGPLPIGAGGHGDDRGGPAPGFIESLAVREGHVWARLDLGPELFAQVVDRREWRGFSIEAVHGLDAPTATLEGWVIRGGTFTNRPATDVHFKIPESIAASAGNDVSYGQICLSLALPGRSKENPMPDTKTPASGEAKTVSLEYHESQVREIKTAAAGATEQVTSLTASLEAERGAKAKLQESLDVATSELASAAADRDTAKARVNQQEAALSTKDKRIASLEAALTEAHDRARSAEDAVLGDQVRAIVLDATADKGIPPAFFDGHEKDPAGWMKANFASLDAFKDRVSSLKGLRLTTDPAKSGHDPSKSADASGITLSAKEQAKLAEIVPGGAKFGGVTSEAEARKRFAASQKQEK